MARGTTRIVGIGALTLSAVVPLAGCGARGRDADVQRIVVCAGVDDQHPAGTPVRISLRQGRREVASVSTGRGALVALLVPDVPTAVLTDGRQTGSVGWDGPGELRPDSEPAPDETAVQAAAHADPDDVQGYVALTGPGCPPPSQVDLDGTSR